MARTADAVRDIVELFDAKIEARGVPPGGLIRMILRKATGTDFDDTWSDLAGGVAQIDNSVPRWDGTDATLLQSSKMTIDDAGFVTSYTESTSGGFRAESYGTGANHVPQNQMSRARGSFAAPAKVLAGDFLGRMLFRGHNGANFTSGGAQAEIRGVAKQDGDLGGAYLIFMTTPNGGTSANLAERMRIEHDGVVSISVRLALPGDGVQVNAGNANFSITSRTDLKTIRLTGAITADRTLTLNTAGAVAGETFRIVRTGSGAFNWNIGTGPLKALAVNTWCDVTYDGAAWFLSAYGSL